MDVRTKPLIPTRRPTTAERVLYFVVGISGGLVLMVLALLLEWSRSSLVISGFVFGAIYVVIATPMLLGRRADS